MTARLLNRPVHFCSEETIQKIAVALANADGGEFMVGIADDDDEPDSAERWKGASKDEEFNPHVQAISEIRPPLAAEYCVLDGPDRRCTRSTWARAFSQS